MIFHRLGLIHKNQRGFTLIELMIAIGITSLITGGIVTAIFQVFNINTLSTNHMLALRQVQNAGYWISHDTQMALPQSIDAESDDINEADPDDPDDSDHPLFPQADGQTQVLFLYWVGWEYESGGNETYTDTYEVYYTYDTANGKLWRYQRITTNEYNTSGQLVETTYSPEEGWDTTFIAGYITSIPPVTWDGDKLVIIITATIGDAEEIRTYEISPRPSS